MELSGKVFKVMPVESGEGKNGVWKKQQVILEMDNGKYTKKVAVTFWGDLVDSANFVDGKDISVEFDVESREYNGKWFTDVKAWRINTVAKNGGGSDKKEEVPTSTIDDDLLFNRKRFYNKYSIGK